MSERVLYTGLTGGSIGQWCTSHTTGRTGLVQLVSGAVLVWLLVTLVSGILARLLDTLVGVSHIVGTGSSGSPM